MQSGAEEVPLGSLLIKSRHSVRKRVPAPSTLATPPLGNRSINPRLIYDDYAKIQKEPATIGIRIRNCVLIIVMLFFPFFIFMISMLIHRDDYPRLVVVVRTSKDRLSSLEPLLTKLVQEKVATVYLAIPGEEDESSGAAELPAFLEDMISDQESTRDASQVQLLYSNTKPEQTLSFVVTLVLQLEQQMANIRKMGAGGLESTDDEESTTRSSVADDETRIVIMDEESPWPSISSLVQGSIKEPDAVLSGVGAIWRSNFRQVKVAVQSSSSLDKFPNIALLTTNVMSRSEDVLDSSTGIIFREGLLIPTLPALSQKLHDLLLDVSSRSFDSMLLEPEAEDVVWSALLEAVNVTRRIVPMGHYAPNSARNTTTRAYLSGHWMAAAFQLQQRWKVWQQYTFLDWSSLTSDQKNDIACEGFFDQECDADICRPNPTHCSNYSSIWSLGKEHKDI